MIGMIRLLVALRTKLLIYQTESLQKWADSLHAPYGDRQHSQLKEGSEFLTVSSTTRRDQPTEESHQTQTLVTKCLQDKNNASLEETLPPVNSEYHTLVIDSLSYLS